MGNKISKIVRFYRQFGLVFSTKYYFYKLFKKDKKYINLVYRYLLEDNAEIIEKYRSLNNFKKDNHCKKLKTPVWVCWWQGYDNMPSLCKMFYKRLSEMLPDNAELILVTRDNYLKYASIPDVIRNRFEQGCISMTTYSDVLRNYLLRDNGGLWIDASVFVSKEISEEFLKNRDWWSVNLYEKNANIENLGQKITERKWSGFLQKGTKGNILNSYLCDSFVKYYENHNCLVDYFIQNLYIKAAYENIPQIRDMIDRIPNNNIDVYSLYDNIDKPFNENLFNKWNSGTTFYKMTQKREYKSYIDGRMTFFGAVEKICGGEHGEK
jgi:hypothetical protein